MTTVKVHHDRKHLRRARVVVWRLLAVVASIAPLVSRATDDNAAGNLSEVIVTAERRVENLQDVPLSVLVVGNQELTQENHNSLSELTQTVPGVHVDSGNFNNTLFVRGIGSGGNPGFDQSVAMFSDDVYHGRSRMSGATFLDLDRIEVLRGPQSTFFGSNAIAGALNIVTKRPSDHMDSWARALYGQFGEYAFEGAIGGPITDSFGARIAATRNGVSSGWVYNVNLGEHVPRINNEAARLTLLFHLGEDFDTTMKVEGSRNRVSGTNVERPLQWINCPPPAPFPPSFGANGACPSAIAAGVPTGVDNNDTTGLAGAYNQLSTAEGVLTINYRRWGQIFSSVSGYYNYHFNANMDNGLQPEPYLTQQVPEKYHQFSQEFRVTSTTGERLEYLVGLYFQKDELETDKETNAFFVTPLIQGLLPQFNPYVPLGFGGGYSQSERVYSAFGSLGLTVANGIKLTAGLRGSWIRKEMDEGNNVWGTATETYGGLVPLPEDLQFIGDLFGIPSGTSQPLSYSDHAWMPSAGIQYHLNPSAMVYFRYDRGFKAGGFDAFNPLNPPNTIQYGPEHVNAYEFGIKSTWADDRVLLNLSVFRSDYNGLQAIAGEYHSQTNTFSSQIRNVAASRSEGVEFEGQWVIAKTVRIGANVAYLNSYYVSYPNGPATNSQIVLGQQFQDLSGARTPYAPLWSGSINGTYTMALPGEYELTTELSPYFSSTYNAGFANDPFDRVAGYMRLDGRLSFQHAQGAWVFDLIGKNLTDRAIVIQPGFDWVSKEKRRNVALQVRYRW